MIQVRDEKCRKHAYRSAKFVAVKAANVDFACSDCISEMDPDKVHNTEEASIRLQALARENAQLAEVRRVIEHFRASLDEVARRMFQQSPEERDLEDLITRLRNGHNGPSVTLLEFVRSEETIAILNEKIFPVHRAREDLLRMLERQCNTLRQLARLDSHEHPATSESVARHHAQRTMEASRREERPTQHANRHREETPNAHTPEIMRMFQLLTASEGSYTKYKNKSDELIRELDQTKRESAILKDKYEASERSSKDREETMCKKLKSEHLAAVRSLEKISNDLRQEINNLKADLRKKAEDNDRLTQERSAIVRAQAEIRKLQNDLTEKLRESQKTVAGGKGRQERLKLQKESLQKQLATAKQEQASREQEILNIRLELRKASSDSQVKQNNLQQALAQNVQARQTLQNEKNVLMEKNTRLQADKVRLEAEKTKLQADRTTLQTENKQLQTDKGKLQTDKTQLENDKIKLKDEHTKLEAENKTLKEKYESRFDYTSSSHGTGTLGRFGHGYRPTPIPEEALEKSEEEGYRQTKPKITLETQSSYGTLPTSRFEKHVSNGTTADQTPAKLSTQEVTPRSSVPQGYTSWQPKVESNTDRSNQPLPTPVFIPTTKPKPNTQDSASSKRSVPRAQTVNLTKP